MGTEEQNNYWNNYLGYGYPYMYNQYQNQYNQYNQYNQPGAYNPYLMQNPQMFYGYNGANQGGFAPFITQESINEYLATQAQGTANPQTGSGTTSSTGKKHSTREERYGSTSTTMAIPLETKEEKKPSEKIGETIQECWQCDENITLREYRKAPWYSGKRVTRALKNAGKGVLKTLGGFIGFENGKWNAKKCAKNLAFAGVAAAACCIPYVGPVIGTALMATGVATGAIGVVKGASKVAKANTMEELDHAWEDIGTGAFVGISSAVGLKRQGAKFREANPNGYVVRKKGSAPKTTVETGKVIEAKSDSWFADTFINSFKGAKARANADKVSCIENGFGNTLWSKLRGRPIQKHKTETEFKAELSKAKSDLTREISKLDRKINAETDLKKKYVMEQLKASLETQRGKLDKVNTMDEWVALKEQALETADDIEALSRIQSNCSRRKGWYETLNDGTTKVTFKKGDKKLISDAIDEITAARKTFSGTVDDLAASRHESMLNAAQRATRRNKGTLDKYFGSEKAIWEYKKFAKSELYANAEQTLFKQVFGINNLFKPLVYPITPYVYGALTGSNAFYNIERVFFPSYAPLLSDEMKNTFSTYINGLSQPKQEETTGEASEETPKLDIAS